jgi:putative spermidine/putrescine transport system ATP-binding protein
VNAVPHVLCHQISTTYGVNTVLREVDLSIAQGELVTLLGPSGCGKTTLLRAIAGLSPATSGRVVIAGNDVTHVPPRDRPIGMVFQQYALFPNLRVRDNIAFPLSVRRRPRDQIVRRVEELLALVGLEHVADRMPHQLSGGQQQRVALARALAPNPDVLLLDEPLSALDAEVRGRLRDEIRRIQTRLGMTTVFVTHDQSEALAISDRVAVMNGGRIEQCARPSEIYTSPVTSFAARFVGNRNVLEVHASGGRARMGSLFDIPTTAPDGALLTVVFLPEDVRLVREGAGAEALVETKIYGGARTQVHCRLLHADVAATVVVDLGSRDAGILPRGTRVHLALDPDHARVYGEAASARATAR